MMAGQGKTLPALGRGSANDILGRAVVLDKVHVEGYEVLHLMPQIPRRAQSLEKDLGQDHC